MQFRCVAALLGLAAGLATAAPLSPKAGEVTARVPQAFDLTYIDKRAANAHAHAEAVPQTFDLTYIDKRAASADAEAVPQTFDLTYIDKRAANADAEAVPQIYDITYIDRA
ncbi:hypothetical protein B0O99DRAFT_619237 [Bisporella sp. PMI_857]|nr:hypothetical protein B0O99DRAFT_619237 [Bisporella sp. PMI_857]